MKKQIFIIGGGDSFVTQNKYLAFLKNYKINLDRYRAGKKEWKKDLYKQLGKDFEVFLPMMPNGLNAKYDEWKLWLNKFVPYMRHGVTLIGHSLGGLFLTKYLSENKFPKKIAGTFLVAAPCSEGNFTPPKNFKLLEKQGGKIFLYQSKDDTIVPFRDFEKYREKLPSAICRIFDDQWHFIGDNIPGLIKDIKSIYRQ